MANLPIHDDSLWPSLIAEPAGGGRLIRFDVLHVTGHVGTEAGQQYTHLVVREVGLDDQGKESAPIFRTIDGENIGPLSETDGPRKARRLEIDAEGRRIIARVIAAVDAHRLYPASMLPTLTRLRREEDEEHTRRWDKYRAEQTAGKSVKPPADVRRNPRPAHAVAKKDSPRVWDRVGAARLSRGAGREAGEKEQVRPGAAAHMTLWCILVRGDLHPLLVLGASEGDAIDRWRGQTKSRVPRSAIKAEPAAYVAARLIVARVHAWFFRGGEDQEIGVDELGEIGNLLTENGFGVDGWNVARRRPGSVPNAVRVADALHEVFFRDGEETDVGADETAEIADLLTRYGFGRHYRPTGATRKSELEQLCERHGIVIEHTGNGRAVLRAATKTLNVAFRASDAQPTPSAADVLDHVLVGRAMLNDPTTMDGMDAEQRRRARRAIRSELARTRRFLGDDFEAFCNAQH